MTTGGTTRRGRRPVRPTGDDRELAILATAERLLSQRPLAEISIDDLARGAGLSRSTFYFYFRSKDAVLLTLLDRVAEEADRASRPVADREHDDVRDTWRQVITAFHDTFRDHRAVTLAAADARATNAEVRELWAKIMDNWVERTAAAIEAERARGAAPPGLPAREVATALNLMNERVLHAGFAGQPPAIGEPDVVEVLLDIWIRAIY